jgi:hypothetical protein
VFPYDGFEKFKPVYDFNNRIMKTNIIYSRISVLMMIIWGVVSCGDDDQKISYSELPELSQQFIETYFEGVIITKVEKKSGEPHYKVDLANGFEVRFFESGEWQAVDGNGTSIPYKMQIELLPIKIVNYVSENFPVAEMVEMSRHNYGFEIELNTNPETEIHFDKDGNMIVNAVE